MSSRSNKNGKTSIPHTKRTYEQGTKLFADHVLKDGSRAGSKRIGDFTKAFVDAVYAKLLVVRLRASLGKTKERQRPQSHFAVAAAKGEAKDQDLASVFSSSPETCR